MNVWIEVASHEESAVYVPTAADMAEFFEAESDVCRECGGPKCGADSPICTPCDIEQWIVEMENFRG